MTSLISNRSNNLLNNPLQALEDIAASFSPSVASGVQTGLGIASKFIDLGADEMDLKIKNLRSWQLKAGTVQVIGVRLDAFNHIGKNETFNYLIEEIALTYNKSFGDNIGISITLLNMLNLEEDPGRTRRGGKLGADLPFDLPPGANPF